MNHHKQHRYSVTVAWTGNLGRGTSDYCTYTRDYGIIADGKPDIAGSADPTFRGDPARYNPEDLLVASLSACHMLWYLHLCAEAGIIVLEYIDQAWGVMTVAPGGAGRFQEVVLAPRVAIEPNGDTELAEQLHERAHRLCFIANSVNFPIRCEPDVHSRQE